MIVSRAWLASYFKDPIPDIKKITDLFTFHTFEIESAEGDILDIKVLPDRAHYALSHRGIAYELSALIGMPLQEKTQVLPPSTVDEPLSIHILDESFCRRYVGARVENVSGAVSPDWLVQRLESIGQQSINAIVDATNFVMFDIGQPMHAFDADKVRGSITVRPAKDGEEILLLPERNAVDTERKVILKQTDYVIADDEGALAIAGVKGGTRAQVTNTTNRIILEAAHFNPVSVRRTATAYDMRNESSKRFENEITPELAREGMESILAIISDICPNARCGAICDVYPKPAEPRTVTIHPSRISKMLGIEIPAERMIAILETLSIQVRKVGDALELDIPLFRLDLSIPEDIAEEIGRIYGYEHIPNIPLLPVQGAVSIHKGYYYTEKIRTAMEAQGFFEVYTYSLSSSGSFEIVKSASDKHFVRDSLSENLQHVLLRNTPNAPLLGIDTIRVFEIGRVFPKTGEVAELGIAIHDIPSKGKKNAALVAESLDILSKLLGVDVMPFARIEGNVAIVAYSSLLESLPEPERYDVLPRTATYEYKKISIYPFIVRDIAVWVPEHVSAHDLEEVLKDTSGDLLAALPRLVDTYAKDGRVSYAFRLVFQSYEKTLTDAEVNEIMKTVTDAIVKKGWEVR